MARGDEGNAADCVLLDFRAVKQDSDAQFKAALDGDGALLSACVTKKQWIRPFHVFGFSIPFTSNQSERSGNQ